MEPKFRKTIKDYLYNVSYQILIIILPVITAPYVARVLGAEGVGQHAFAYTVAHYFLLFAMMGVNSYGSRSIAEVRDDRDKTATVFSGIVYLQQTLSALMLFLYALYTLVLAGGYSTLAAIQAMYVLSAAFDINWFFFGMEQFKLTAMRRIVIKLLSVICVFIFVRDRDDLWVYSLIMALDFLVAQVYLWLVIRRFTRFVKVPVKVVIAHLKGMVVLFIPSIATSIYRNLSKLLLGILVTMTAVGLFEYSEKIILMSLGLLNALSTVMLPKMTVLRAHNREDDGRRYLRGSMQFALFLASAIAFGYSAIAPEFAVVFFGVEFAQATELMQGLAVSVFFIAWANVVRMQYLIPNNLEKILMLSTFVGFGINLLLAFILIPHTGAMGAVITTVMTEFVVAFVQTVLVRKQLEIKRYLLDGLPFLLAGVVMFALVRLLGGYFGQTVHGLVIQVVVGAIVYLGTGFVVMMAFTNPMATIIGIKLPYPAILCRKDRQSEE